MFLEPCLGNSSWTRCLTLVCRNLAWEPVLGSLAWEPVLGSLFLGTCSWEHCLVTCSWELSHGNLFLETLPACFKPVHWDLAREPVFRNFAWEPCLGTCPSEPCSGFCSCLQPCLQMFFEISLCKLFLESCSWEHEQPETMLGNVFVGTVLATYNLLLGTILEICSCNPNLFLGTCSSNPCLGTCSCEACLQTCPWEPCLGTCSWKPCLGTCSQGPCLVMVSS